MLLVGTSHARMMKCWPAGRSRLVEVACDRTSLLAACVSEAVRLRAPGVAVRMAACDLAMPAGPDITVNVNKAHFLSFYHDIYKPNISPLCWLETTVRPASITNLS